MSPTGRCWYSGCVFAPAVVLPSGFGLGSAVPIGAPASVTVDILPALKDGVLALSLPQGFVIDRDRNVDCDRNVDGNHADRADRWAGTTTFALLILVASLIPVSWVAPDGGPVGADGGSGVGVGGGPVDALPADIGLTDPFHLVGYAVLTVLASRAIGRGRRGLLLAAVAAVAFGFAIELVQAPIPWRSFAWGDAAVNAVGAGAGLVAVVAVDVVATARERRSG